MEELLSYLEAIHPMSPGLQKHLRSILMVQEVRKKDLLLAAGQVCSRIYFIQKGIFYSYYESGEHEVIGWFMQEGDIIISVRSFFSQRPSYQSIQALEDGKLYSISYDELQHIYRAYPEFNFTGRVLVEKYYQLYEDQLYGLKKKTAKERFEYFLEHHADLLQRVPKVYLASYLGMNAETLSRLRGV